MPVVGKLNPTQQYLLNRIPNQYASVKHPDVKEPSHIVAAREVVSEWEAEQSQNRELRKNTFEKLRTAAKEAVYMQTEEEALEAIKYMEAFSDVAE